LSQVWHAPASGSQSGGIVTCTGPQHYQPAPDPTKYCTVHIVGHVEDSPFVVADPAQKATADGTYTGSVDPNSGVMTGAFDFSYVNPPDHDAGSIVDGVGYGNLPFSLKAVMEGFGLMDLTAAIGKYWVGTGVADTPYTTYTSAAGTWTAIYDNPTG